eukprot:361322-Chlamydomonas_euryale.AAC.8
MNAAAAAGGRTTGRRQRSLQSEGTARRLRSKCMWAWGRWRPETRAMRMSVSVQMWKKFPRARTDRWQKVDGLLDGRRWPWSMFRCRWPCRKHGLYAAAVLVGAAEKVPRHEGWGSLACRFQGNGKAPCHAALNQATECRLTCSLEHGS